MVARPSGAWIVENGEVTWKPAIDVNRIVLGGQIIAMTAIIFAGRIQRLCSSLSRSLQGDPRFLRCTRLPLGADERLRHAVELTGGEARLEALAHVGDRGRDQSARPRDPLDLLGVLADDHRARPHAGAAPRVCWRSCPLTRQAPSGACNTAPISAQTSSIERSAWSS